MRRKILFFIGFLLVLGTFAYAGYHDYNDGVYEHSNVSVMDGKTGNRWDMGIDCWNFEENAPLAYETFVKGSPGILYGWSMSLIGAGTSGYANLYNKTSFPVDVSIGKMDELSVNTYVTATTPHSFINGLAFTELLINRSMHDTVNVFVWYK